MDTKRAPIISADRIWKVYGQHQHQVEAIRDVSMTILEGEITVIMGPSGSGKTTLLNCMSGLDSVSRGSVIMEGNRRLHEMKMSQLDALRAESMGFVFQTYNLIPVLTASENVEQPLLCKNVPAREARLLAKEALIRVGLLERAGHLPSELSGGQRQRAALARAIVNKPKIVWADEPTGALDRKSADLVMDLIQHLNRVDGMTFVIITHNPDVARRGHRIFYMDSGQIIQEQLVK